MTSRIIEKACYFKDPKQLMDKTINRIYVGNEFCEFLFPPRDLFTGLIKKIKAQKKEATLVLPPLNSAFLSIAESLIKIFFKSYSGGEVVINDFGALCILNKKFPSLEPVLGRLLAHQSLLKFQPAREVHLAEKKKFVREYGIKRIELNNIPFKISPYSNILNEKFAGSLNYPYVYLTYTLHNCPFRYCEGAFPYSAPKNYCSKPCSRYALKMDYEPKFVLIKESNSVFLIGKAKFIKVESLNNLKQKWIDRIVFNSIF